MIKRFVIFMAISVLGIGIAAADGVGTVGLSQFPERGGEGLYDAVCVSCHMPEGKGAVGAGIYPHFINNPNLTSAVYVAHVVVYGKGGMPAFGGVLDDEQVANIVNYIRTSFGNKYEDMLTPEAVESMRIPGFIYNDLD